MKKDYGKQQVSMLARGLSPEMNHEMRNNKDICDKGLCQPVLGKQLHDRVHGCRGGFTVLGRTCLRAGTSWSVRGDVVVGGPTGLQWNQTIRI